MPRKPKPPRELIVQPLSAQAKSFAEVQASFVDEWTGELMPMKTEALAELVVSNPKVITDYRRRAKAVKLAKEYLTAQRYHEQREAARKLIQAQINPPKVEPKPASNQVFTASGLVITIPRNPNALKRRL